MSQGSEQKHDVNTESRRLLQGRLKHTRTAALALALVPLAAVAVTTTPVNEPCASGGICGIVFSDENGNGLQEPTEPGIVGVSVTITFVVNGSPVDFTVVTSPENGNTPAGAFDFGTTVPPGEWTISAQIPNDMTPSLANVGEPAGGPDVANDSDGVSDGNGNSTAKVTWDGSNETSLTDFGFTSSAFSNPGTGTPGYWMNHPEAWPVQSLVIGGVTYTKAQAIAALQAPTAKDKKYTIFASLVAAMLNVHPAIGNDPSCVSEAMASAQNWFATYGPVGSGAVAASSYAWKVGEPFHRQMDNYNNGMLCAPHRD